MSISYDALHDLLLSDLGFNNRDLQDDYYSDNSPLDVCRLALAKSFFKKLVPTGSSPDADANALTKFLAINESLPDTDWDFSAGNEAESVFYDYFKHNLENALGDTTGSEVHIVRDVNGDILSDTSEVSLDFLRANVNVGPGSAQKAASPMTLVSKLFEGPISYYGNYHLIALYRAMLVETGFWGEAEMLRFKKYGFTRVKGTKIFFAKKNAEISRVCGTEASLEMLFQKALGEFAEKRLGTVFGISLDRQPTHNRRMAMLGSISGTECTIDLISASDCISLHMLRKSLRPCSFMNLVEMTRSPFAVLPNGQSVELKMVSTMGNGFTFPLQTIIFASAVRAVYTMMNLPSFDPSSQFGVFGDDIIVHKTTYIFLVKMLNKLGFRVNERKSFHVGPFRESCGEDYFNGVNVRGVYIQSLESPQLVCSAINRLNRWSARTGIELPFTISFLKAHVPQAPLVPPGENDEAGIHVPFVSSHPKVSNRYWFKYRKWLARTIQMTPGEPDDTQNPLGSGVGFLSGHYRRSDESNRDTRFLGFGPSGPYTQMKGVPPRGEKSFKVSLRNPPGVRLRYQIVSSEIPWWDYVGARDEWKLISFDRWKAIVAAQL